MSKVRVKFFCQECGHESAKWLGRCPGCGAWNTLVEEITAKTSRTSPSFKSGSEPQPITSVEMEDEIRYFTESAEFDRVLGGGIVPGSLVLVGGDPGIGKSTLLLKVAYVISKKGLVLYITGEESSKQIRMRAERLGTLRDNLLILTETDVEIITGYIDSTGPLLVIVDSIQTMYREDIPSAPGSLVQVRECASHFMRLAKNRGIPVILVGHVTKEGSIAGPRVLEHMVDTVLYFEGERHHSFRVLRAVKNRFGSTNEIGIFEMGDKGLVEVANPSEMFLAERPTGVAGSVVVASLEGTRPLLVEIQALVSPSSFGNPRRMTAGFDYNRMALIMAVLEKRVGLHMGNMDAFVNVAGGVRLDEPAVDLGVALALASSFKDIPANPRIAVVGEIGLTGEVRAVGQVVKRVKEAAKLGFDKCIIPAGNLKQCHDVKDINIIGVESIPEAFEFALGGD